MAAIVAIVHVGLAGYVFIFSMFMLSDLRILQTPVKEHLGIVVYNSESDSIIKSVPDVILKAILVLKKTTLLLEGQGVFPVL